MLDQEAESHTTYQATIPTIIERLLPSKTEGVVQGTIPEVVVLLTPGTKIFVPTQTVPCKGNDSMLMVGEMYIVSPDTAIVINSRVINSDQPGDHYHSLEGVSQRTRIFNLEENEKAREIASDLFNPEKPISQDPLGIIESKIYNLRARLLSKETLKQTFEAASEMIHTGARAYSRDRFEVLIKGERSTTLIADCNTAIRIIEGIQEVLGKSKIHAHNIPEIIPLIEELRNLHLIHYQLSILFGLVDEKNLSFITQHYGSRSILHVNAPFAEADVIHFLYPNLSEASRLVRIPTGIEINIGIRGYRVSEEQIRKRTPVFSRSPLLNLRGTTIYKGIMLLSLDNEESLYYHIFEITDPNNSEQAKYVAVPRNPNGEICYLELLQAHNLRVKARV